MTGSPPRRVRVIGPGRAGGSLQLALCTVGWSVAEPVGRGDDVAGAAVDVDLVVIAVPDSAIAEVAAAVTPVADTVVVHLAGSLGLDVLDAHTRRGALHPLVSMPSAEVGAGRLRGATFAVAGDPMVHEVVVALDGRSFEVADADRAAYHAAACIASNHLVALLGQVERVAATAGLPLDAYLPLVRATIDNVAALGPAVALTGPAARGDEATLAAHRAALDPDELAAYDAMVGLAQRRAGEAPTAADG